jgi:hypothetical protein
MSKRQRRNLNEKLKRHTKLICNSVVSEKKEYCREEQGPVGFNNLYGIPDPTPYYADRAMHIKHPY